MKSATERRLLFALLLSSLVPLLALGFLSVAVVDRLDREIRRQDATAHLAQLDRSQAMRCLEAAERLSSFLWRRQGDARALAAAPRETGTFERFLRDSLAPLWTTGAGGRRTRSWVPLYTGASFSDARGRPLVVVGDPASASSPGAAGPVAAGVRVAPVVNEGSQSPDAFSGLLRLTFPVRTPTGSLAGILGLLLDPRQVRPHVFDPARVQAAVPAREERGRWTFFFGEGGTPLFFPVAEGRTTADRFPAVAAHLAEVVARVRAGEAGVISDGAASPVFSIAYAPVQFDTGPEESLSTLGGVLLYAEAAPEPATPRAGPFSTLTRGTEFTIAGLTLAASLGVVFAALLVARRMSRPWTRLREKARAVSAETTAAGPDEVDEISRSFDSLSSQVVASAGRLRASEERLREFLEMNPDGIAVTDPDGRHLHFNRALCQILRRTPAELADLRAPEVYARPEEYGELLSRLREKGRLTNYEVEFRRGDGTVFPALLTLRLAATEQGECIDTVIRDISELVEVQRKDREKTEALFRVYGELSRAHQDLRRAYGEVEEQVRRKTHELRNAYEALQVSDRVKTEFLMKMSHELRTPLNCIIGYSEAMIDGLDGPLSGDQARSLERIAESGRRLLRMIENLLDLSRLEAGRMEFVCAETSVAEAVEDVLHQARPLVGGRLLTLEAGLEAGLPPAWADPDRLRQVLFNLIGNALKFTQRGRVAIEARRVDGRSLEIRVADTGPGVPAEHLATIFEKFSQVPGGDRAGAGLGLAICRELLDQMGGTIRAESAVGEGSTFVVTIPVASSRPGQLTLPLDGDPARLS